jgi:hypothetical protein
MRLKGVSVTSAIEMLRGCRRFSVELDKAAATIPSDAMVIVYVYDGRTIVFATEPVLVNVFDDSGFTDEFMMKFMTAVDEAEAWLNANHPDWRTMPVG